MLRRTPRRTAALLAANRANAQKSTGPRTILGKQRSAANAFFIGDRASRTFWTRTLSHRELAEYRALHDTIDAALLDRTEGRRLSAAATYVVWTMTRIWERELRRVSLAERRRLAEGSLGLPRVWHRTIRCSLWDSDQSSVPGHDSVPGQVRFGIWKVTITVLMRRGRRRWRAGSGQAGRVAHVITKITCTNHPMLDGECAGIALSTKPLTRTKPEYVRKQGNYENISALCNWSGSPASNASHFHGR